MTDAQASLVAKAIVLDGLAQRQIEQLRVQLAGCSVAAAGWDKGECRQGDWGWSVAFDDVRQLRGKFDVACKALDEITQRYKVLQRERHKRERASAEDSPS